MRRAEYLRLAVGMLIIPTAISTADACQTDLDITDSDFDFPNNFYINDLATAYHDPTDYYKPLYDTYHGLWHYDDIAPDSHRELPWQSQMMPRMKTKHLRSTSPGSSQLESSNLESQHPKLLRRNSPSSNPQPKSGHGNEAHSVNAGPVNSPANKEDEKEEPYQWTLDGPEESLKISVSFPPGWLDNTDSSTPQKGNDNHNQNNPEPVKSQGPHNRRDEIAPLFSRNAHSSYAKHDSALQARKEWQRMLPINDKLHARMWSGLLRAFKYPKVRQQISMTMKNTQEFKTSKLRSSNYRSLHLKDPSRIQYLYTKDGTWSLYTGGKKGSGNFQYPLHDNEIDVDHRAELQIVRYALIKLLYHTIFLEKKGSNVKAPNFISMVLKEVIPKDVEKLPAMLKPFYDILNDKRNLVSLPKPVNNFKGVVTAKVILQQYKQDEEGMSDGVNVKLGFDENLDKWTADRVKPTLSLLQQAEWKTALHSTQEQLVAALSEIIKQSDPGADHQALADVFGQILTSFDKAEIGLLTHQLSKLDGSKSK